MSRAVMGLPFAGHIGVPFTSTGFAEWMAGKSLPSLPLWVREVGICAPGSDLIVVDDEDVASVF